MRIALIISHAVAMLFLSISTIAGFATSAPAFGLLFLLSDALLGVDLFMFVIPSGNVSTKAPDFSEEMPYEPESVYTPHPAPVSVQPAAHAAAQGRSVKIHRSDASTTAQFAAQPSPVPVQAAPIQPAPINASVGVHTQNDPGASKPRRACKKCHSQNIYYQTVSEGKSSGCLTILLYIFLAVSVIGWLVLIPLLLRNKSQTVTYAVCQNCGHRWRVK